MAGSQYPGAAANTKEMLTRQRLRNVNRMKLKVKRISKLKLRGISGEVGTVKVG